MISYSSKFIVSVLFVLLLDQAIKFLAVNEIIDLEFSKNSGALFGIQLNANFIFAFFAVFLFVAIIGFRKIRTFSLPPRCNLSAEDCSELRVFSSQSSAERLRRGGKGGEVFKKNSAVAIMAFCLMLGGIVSNLIDRILYGQIIDYINLSNLFFFNIADLAICFGALVLSWKVLGR